MQITLKNGQIIEIRRYREKDFELINKLNVEEKWTNLVENEGNTKEAWNNSSIGYVAVINEQIISYIRGLTDKYITLFICELLISSNYRGLGIGETLLQHVHQMYPKTRIEMLATHSSRTYYEQKGYRPFYGFRKTYNDY